jgi:outer membrane lipoprotein SlyB
MGFLRTHRRTAVCIRALLLGVSFTTFACHAQDSNSARVLTPEEAVRVQNMAYLRVMQDKCPFSKQVADDFGFISMIIGMQMAPIGKSDMDAAMVKAEVIADKNIALSKDVACERAEEVVRKLGEAIGRDLKSGR